MRGLLLETAGWAVVACGVWLATLSGITVPELCFAAAAGIPCGILARAGRRALGASWRFRPGWLAWPFPVVATLLAEFVVLVRIAVRRPRSGELGTVDLPAEEPELAAGRAAASALAFCSTPGSLVADTDPEQQRLTVHTLLAAGPDLREVVRR